MPQGELIDLSNVALMALMDEGERERLRGRCRWERYRSGQTILDRGDQDRDVFLVVEGSVQVINYSSNGREISFGIVGAGDYFGELSAIDGLPRSANVKAAEDTLVAKLSAEAFHEVLRSNAEIAFEVLQKTARIVRLCDDRIMDLSTLGAVQRVYSEVLRMAVPDAASPELWVIRPIPPMREVASRVSAARETVARAMSQLRDLGLVRRKGRNLYILDRGRLEQLIVALGSG